MTNSKSTKRALFSSVVALLLCFTMLLGTTFAWFTDSATSGNNIIKTGNLDMKLSYKPYGAENTEWTEVTESTVLFGKDALYEPGYTEAVWLKVENLGSLAFRYDLAINVASEKQGTNKAGEKFSLSDYLDVKYMTTTSTDMESGFYTTRESLDSFAFGSAANSGVASLKDEIAVIKNGVAFSANDATNGAYSSAYVLVVISMPTTVGNEANHDGKDIPQIDFSLTALATQLAYESDSFGSDYDKDATYDDSIIKAPETAAKVTNFAELKAAMANGGDIAIMNDIAIEETLTVVAPTVIYGQGHTLTSSVDNINLFTMSADMALTINGANIKDVTTNGSLFYFPNNNNKTLNLTNVTIENCKSTNEDVALIVSGTVASNDNNNINFTNVKVMNNVAAGDLFNHYGFGTTTMKDCVFSGNNAAWDILYFRNPNCVIDGGSFVNNTTGAEYNIINKQRNTHLTIKNGAEFKGNNCGQVIWMQFMYTVENHDLASGIIAGNTCAAGYAMQICDHVTIGADMTINGDINVWSGSAGTSELINNGTINGNLNFDATAIYDGTGTLTGTITRP